MTDRVQQVKDHITGYKPKHYWDHIDAEHIAYDLGAEIVLDELLPEETWTGWYRFYNYVLDFDDGNFVSIKQPIGNNDEGERGDLNEYLDDIVAVVPVTKTVTQTVLEYLRVD